MKTVNTTFGGYDVTVMIPDNPNGKWIWKTEFFTAFDSAERALFDMGYTRVYYKISNKYGSYHAVRLMHRFYKFAVEEFGLSEKCILFGFSRGGLYAFNFSLFYPEAVEKIYLDAPVLDMRTWPLHGTMEREEVYAEYGLTRESIERFGGHPIENLKEFFENKIPTLIVAGDSDEVVPYEQNSKRLIDYAQENGIDIRYYVKPGCGHHPHSLEDVTPIIDFVKNH